MTKQRRQTIARERRVEVVKVAVQSSGAGELVRARTSSSDCAANQTRYESLSNAMPTPSPIPTPRLLRGAPPSKPAAAALRG